MSAYQVGRPAIREAMQNLQWMGLVDIRHGERPRVAEPSMEGMVDQIAESMRHLLMHSATTMQHLKEARAAFETQMARTAAESRTDEDIAGLRQILESQRLHAATPEKFLEEDAAFHRKVSSIGGNPIFESLSVALFSWLAQFHVDFVRSPGLEKLVLEEHGMILDAIEAGDADRAGNAMRDHINRANRLYSQANLAG